MATIGSLVIGMSADTNPFVRGMKKSSDALAGVGSAAAKVQGAFGRLNFGSAAAGLAKTRAGVNGLGGALFSVKGAIVALGAAEGIHRLAGGIVGAAGAASDLNEQVSKSRTVFGKSSELVEAKAREMGDAFGYPKAAFIEGASSIGLIAKASGLAQPAAAKLGADFAAMAADASSFYNVPVEDALMAIRSGLVGEAEPMRRFGVLLNEAAVKSEAVRLGLARFGAELTEGQKVQARSSLIMKGMSDAQGDLARTADSAANKVRTVFGRLTNLGADFGTAIQPATDAVLALADNAMVKLAEVVAKNKGALAEWAEGAGKSGGVILDVMAGVGKALGMVLDVVGTIKLGFLGLQAVVGDVATFIAKIGLAANTASDAVYRMTMGIDPRSRDGSEVFLKGMEDGAAELHKKFTDALVLGPPSAAITKFFDGLKASAAGAAKALGGAGAAVKSVGADTGALAGKVSQLETDLQGQIAAFGKSSTEVQIYKLKLAGVTEDQLKNVRALSAQHTAWEKAKAVFEETRTPLEKYQKKLAELDMLLKRGDISKQTYGRAKKSALAEVEPEEKKYAGALELGSTEARSAALKYRGAAPKETEIKAVAKNTEKQVDLQQKTVDLLGKLAGKAFDKAIDVFTF